MHLRPWAAGQTSCVTCYRIARHLPTNDRCGQAAAVVECRPKASSSSDLVAPPSCASPSLRHTYLIAIHLFEVSNVVEMVAWSWQAFSETPSGSLFTGHRSLGN
jgi:hypothetical protein